MPVKRKNLSLRSAAVVMVLALASPIAGCSSHQERMIKAVRLVNGTDHTTMSLWGPTAQWKLKTGPLTGNPFDVVATAVFHHAASGRTISTELFYVGGNHYAFRFTPTVMGTWAFVTESLVDALNGHSGTVTVTEPRENSGDGFITATGSQWTRSRNGRPFVPQLVMYKSPRYLIDINQIRADIESLVKMQGFNGFHVPGACHWFDIDVNTCDDIKERNPDPATFEALESLITEAYHAGTTVHLWLYGDSERNWNPSKWGLNGVEDRRLQRYIAARLGPLPGWTMGYGFDLDEWAARDDLKKWHAFMHSKFGWPHLLGGRSKGPNRGIDHDGMQIYEGLDYASYEHHQPSYEVYRAASAANPTKPVFSEDRFRIRERNARSKDFTLDMTRRALWNSTMAGGVANIFGNLSGPDWKSVLAHGVAKAAGDRVGHYVFGNLVGDKDNQAKGSKLYPMELYGRTYQQFFAGRLMLQPDLSSLASGQVAMLSQGIYLTYAEETEQLDLAEVRKVLERATIIAVDAKKEYAELKVQSAALNSWVWQAPYRSDWAISVSWTPGRGS